jgi:hypothetical protein
MCAPSIAVSDISTVDLAASTPSFLSSRTVLGEPQVGFAAQIRLINARNSGGIPGRPAGSSPMAASIELATRHPRAASRPVGLDVSHNV